ncbi:MAG: RNA polymerase sigma factor, partial [Planctomycetia bacterium]
PLAQAGDLPGLRLGAGRADEAARAERRAADAQLVARALKGDPDAFGTLVERYQRQVYWVAYDILLDAEEARDVAQETFLRAHAALAAFDPSRDLLNWLYRIARNLAIDAHRRRRRRATPTDDLTEVPEASGASATEQVDAAAEARHLRAKVDAVLADLPPDYRLALTLREMHGMTPLEIARVTDCSYPTARWRVHRARAMFRAAWEARHGAPPQLGGEA